MVAMPRLHENEVGLFRNTTVSENYWTNETLENRFWR